MRHSLLLSLTVLFFFSCSDILNSADSDSDSNTKPDGNDNISSATALTLGTPVTMKIYPEDDIDCFRVNIPRGGVLKVVLRNMPPISIYMNIVDSEDSELKHVSTMNTSGTDDSVEMHYLAKAAQYFIKVRSLPTMESKQECSLLAWLDTLDANEWNNDTANATTLTLDKVYRATIYPAYDDDFYRLTVDSNQIVRVALDSFSTKTNFNAEIDLLDFEGTRISYKYITSGDQNTIGYSLKRGTYYFQINDRLDDASSELPYKISVSKDTLDKTEWNDDTAHAFQMALGDTAKATIFPNADVDYFRFEVTQADTIRFSVDSISSKLPSFRLYLFDEELVSLGSAYDDDQGGLRYKKYLMPGQYYVKIYSGQSWDGEFSDKRYYFTVSAGL